jgi:integrase/recombinase XerD
MGKLLCFPNRDAACMDTFIKELQARECDEKTIQLYQSDINIFRTDVAKDLLDVAAEDVYRVIEGWQAQNLSAATLQRRASSLRQFYNLLYNLGLISARPTASLRVPKPWKRVKVHPAEDLELVISAIGVESPFDIRDRAVLLLLRDSGIRATAIAKCEVANIDWKLSRMMLRDDKYAKDHWVPLSKRCLAAITLYLEKSRPYFLHGRELPFMFPSARSLTPLTRQRVWQIAERWSKEVLGVKVSPHAWRRALLTEGSEKGMEVFDLMQMAGHENPETTQHYLRHSNGKLRDIFYKAHPLAGKGVQQ